MKNPIFLLVIGFACFTGFAQHDYDAQGILYSSPKALTIGSATQIGSYSEADAKALELYSASASTLYMKTGNQSLIISNNLVYGNFMRVPNNFPFHFSMNGLVALRIQTDGDIGIGTSLHPQGYKLAVGGKIIAEELKVQLQTAWPDYVFSSDYKLPTLQEVEKQIQDKGHLANIPSATEVKENGFEVGEMARVQQEKIEELTLYIIVLNKKLEAQEKKLLDLEAQINK